MKQHAIKLFAVAALTGGSGVARADRLPTWASYIDDEARGVAVERQLANGCPACGNIPVHRATKTGGDDDMSVREPEEPKQLDLERELTLFETQSGQRRSRTSALPDLERDLALFEKDSVQNRGRK